MTEPPSPAVGTLAWARDADPSEIFRCRAEVRRELRELTDAHEWGDVIELARLAEMPMARGSRWGSWEQVLLAAAHAARQSGDASAEAWALHQLGTRAMLQDDLARARPVLHDALARREALGETDAALVTRHNLNLLPLALSGVMTLLTFFVGFVALALPVFEQPTEDEARPFLDITEEVIEVGTDGGVAPVELVNRGNVDLVGLKVSPEALFTVESREGCGSISTGDRCELVVDSDHSLSLPLAVCIRYGTDDAPCVADPGAGVTDAGDDAILLTAAPEGDG